MKKYLCILLLAVVFFQHPCLLYGRDKEKCEGIEDGLSLGLGLESLRYRECDSKMGLKSNARVTNIILKFQYQKRWENIISGINGLMPVSPGQDTEEWTCHEILQQSNDMNYCWQRVDGYLGYPFRPWLVPLVGVRWSKAKQERKNFILNNVYISGTSTEKVTSYALLLGSQGGGNVISQLGWNYRIGYFIPLDVTVENTAIHGFKAKNIKGYTIEVTGGIEYSFTESFLLNFQVYWGKMKWKGSDWVTISGDQKVRFPENETIYMGGTTMVTWRF